MNDGKKYIAGAVLLLIILITSVLVYNNRETIFQHKIVIDYPDGCQEIYINGDLTTDKCPEPEPQRQYSYSDLGNFSYNFT